ncbi:MAG: 16S rRNA (adenine(1518)-N(6)/adenine(1519)-N(6))-dimethyltransferase RsmA [Clostridia bacterium]|nr:16S rRNA (adenine(1518)-N(6)/adenine(1519)-N(6))-dimethyltransferase RsmA [Clostridia bacterium]
MFDLTDPGTVQALLRRHGFHFSKSLGQNFLIDPEVCPAMAAACGADAHCGALEIGAGVGVLTAELARVAGKVVSLELDRKLLPVLEETLADFDNIEIVNRDILKTDLPALIAEQFGDMPVCVCANLPYYITSPVVMTLLESGVPFRSITVMVQKEAGERLCAAVGTRAAGAVTVAVQYYANAEVLFEVGRDSFLPAPKVDSAVIRLTPREAPPVQVADESAFFSLVHAVFGQRRKTAENALSAGLGLPKSAVAAALAACGFAPTVRAETMTMAELAKLSDALPKKQ